jgi:2-dehydro-3-deoxyphosphogluconate aldolase / (4S)-4-hydroxy-2-oxoglutarate aldolase
MTMDPPLRDGSMNRQQIVQRIEELGIVPMIRAPSRELAARAARAMVAGGIDVVEITTSVPDALSLLRQLSSELGMNVVLGAGTVLDSATALACIDAGAQFIVAPGLDIETVKAVHQAGKAAIPGALTPTEIIKAWKAGADLIKVFPCSALGGIDYLKALRAPLPHVKLLPTGGITLETAPAYLAAGASALGLGSALIDLKRLEQEGESALRERAAAFVEVVRRARAG